MSELLVFAGTTEGRKLLEVLSYSLGENGPSVHACVATDYGKELLGDNLGKICIHAGRLTKAEMTALMEKHKFDYVIDTTHPYAREASETISGACEEAGCKYLRVQRDTGYTKEMENSNCLFFVSHEEAVEYLDQHPGNVLLTIGSKELHRYTKMRDYQLRLFPRVLPMAGVLESCSALGFAGKQLILMQGPFTADLNAALIGQINARFIVTKDSGEEGGFLEKYQAAVRTGTTLIAVGRESEEKGMSLEEVITFLEKTYNLSLKADATRKSAEIAWSQNKEPGDLGHWFPFFTNITGKHFTVVGAGKIAARRIKTLLRFDCSVKVIAEAALPEIIQYQETERLLFLKKSWKPKDLEGSDYILAATNDRELNHKIFLEAKKQGVPVNVADDKDKSDFYFPGIIRKNGITAGVTAEGKDHRLAKMATRAIEQCLEQSTLVPRQSNKA